jgi:hypothetical protein
MNTTASQGASIMADKQKPIHEIRLGAVKAAIWENETTNGKRHNLTVTRLYKDNDEWKRTESFGRDDLPLLAKVVDLAHTWIFEMTQKVGDGERSPSQHEEPRRTSGRK